METHNLTSTERHFTNFTSDLDGKKDKLLFSIMLSSLLQYSMKRKNGRGIQIYSGQILNVHIFNLFSAQLKVK